jgi:CBS domain-containing protein
MTPIPPELQKITDKLSQGDRHQGAYFGTMLGWFGKSKRGKAATSQIRDVLDELGLGTLPDLTAAQKGTYIQFGLKWWIANGWEGLGGGIPDGTGNTFKLVDPAHEVRRLMPDGFKLIRVSPDDTVKHATSRMLHHDFSQLPVMCNDRQVKGIFSWESFGRQVLRGGSCEYVRECMDKRHAEIKANASLFEAVKMLAEHTAILVRETDGRYIGIINAGDIGQEYHKLAEPFLLLGQIEHHVRNLIAPHFNRDELRKATNNTNDGRDVEDVTGLTLGEYVRLLQDDANWKRLELMCDRATFIEHLEQILSIRNAVMHFDPNPLDPKALDQLRRFDKYLAETCPFIKYLLTTGPVNKLAKFIVTRRRRPERSSRPT